MKGFWKFTLYISITLILTLVFYNVLISNQLITTGRFQNAQIFSSQFDDYAPSVTADDKMMVFNSRTRPESNYDIFVSYNENGTWSKPVPFTVLNSEGNDETPYITPNGQIIVFASDRKGSMRPSKTSDGEQRITYDIYMSYLVNGEWTDPRPVIGDVNTIHNERTPSITQDGRYLYFSRWRFGAIQESKIMRAENNGRRYVDVIELPYPINTGNYEMAFTPTFLGGFFFASLRAGGSGGWDIYYTPSDNEGTKVINMGRDINSGGNDLFLTISRQSVYLTSDRIGTTGGYDIFKAPLISSNIPIDALRFGEILTETPNEDPVEDVEETTVEDIEENIIEDTEENITEDIEDNIIENEIELPLETEPIAEEPVLENNVESERSTIVVKLIDQANRPVSSEILIEMFSDYDAQNFLRRSRINSGYSGTINIFPRDDVKSIRITTLSSNVVETQRIINVEEGAKVEENIPIRYERRQNRQDHVNIRREASQLRPVYFALDSSEIRRSSLPKLHQVLAFLRKYPNVNMQIIGHTDKSGTVQHNETLSRARAQAVRKYFIEMGIDPERLDAIGVGSRHPAMETNDTSLYRFNRRVEFELSD